MRYLALATDYDETIAVKGRLEANAISPLERLRASGRKAILVTGRTVDDLMAACPRLDLFHCVVAENGAVLYWPTARETNVVCEPLPPAFVAALRERRIPHSVGRVIVGSQHPHECSILEIIRELGRELHIVFNGDAVMVLPPGVNKGTGLEQALRRMGLSPPRRRRQREQRPLLPRADRVRRHLRRASRNSRPGPLLRPRPTRPRETGGPLRAW